MARPTVWISTTTDDVDVDGAHPGSHWQLVGFIETSQQADFYTHIQVYIGARRTAKGKPEFYLSGDADREWVQQAKSDPAGQVPFWILINPYGDAPIHYSGGSIKYLVGADKAIIAPSLALREPATHPGSLVKAVMVAIRLRRRNGRLFNPLRTAEHH
ncbi:hypothetical protein SBI67_14345 [Mycolicibacterium sp. 120266]|uniref:hypothetical protein n=1 Tax=Mycolicibacterium sp. 120266 TaxID=3090601 RepID=UPI00299CFB18|nr:hypothetical protein [Mycolicibacterium sp. 120266]MDX1873300.1 hypothetical protein [Mycolicibacterium sp. 120266]